MPETEPGAEQGAERGVVTFAATVLSREQVIQGYEQALRMVESRRLECWINQVMSAYQPAQCQEYETLVTQQDRLQADYALWLERHPTPA